MRIKGRTISGPNIEVVVIPRGNGNDIVFKAQAVLDTKDFDRLCPAPTPPKKMIRGGALQEDVNDEGYRKEMQEWGKRKTHHLILRSLEATDDLQWDTVDMSVPDTWGNYDDEMTQSGFSEVEKIKIVEAVFAANCLNESRLEEARQRFLRFQEAESTNSSSPTAGPPSMPSGVLVKDSA